jgi:hypothetical protein
VNQFVLEAYAGKVLKILSQGKDITEVILDTEHPVKKALNYNRITGQVSVGDQVTLNTTAASLSLGTGGYHFVMANHTLAKLSMSPEGHGMKVRYTPSQVKVSFIEEEFAQQKAIFDTPLNLAGRIVCFGELHSMIPPLCAFFKYFSKINLRIGYIMTDHAALPMAFSKNIAYLKECSILDTVITIGNAFGGDVECVNIYTGMQAASAIQKCDIILVSMGPGITGTGTRYGFSGLDMGLYLDLAYRYGGKCFFIPRISFAETRARHYGISHHSLTILKDIVQSPISIILPSLKKDKMRFLYQQLQENSLHGKHHIFITDGREIRNAMEHYGISVTTMGRGMMEDPAFFYTIGAVAKKALSTFCSSSRVIK